MMFKSLGIGSKILIAFASIAIIAVAIIALLSYDVGRRSLEEESFNKLTAVREMKASQIEDYYGQIVDQAITMSEDRMIINAMRALDQGLHDIDTELDITDEAMESMDAELRSYYKDHYLEGLIPNLLQEVSVSDYWPEDEKARILQYLYLVSNPSPIGSKHLLDNAGDGSSYSEEHEVYHPIIRDFLERFGYYDIFLVDVGTGGHIAYSVFKEVDYGTSLLAGPYSQTNFAQAYRAARDADDKDFVKLVDFEPYAPSYNAPAAFIASPIFDGDEKIGVLVFQMPIDRINDIMTSNQKWADVGLGDSGETYLVGDDFLLRNQSRFLIEDRDNYLQMIEEIGVPLSTRAKIRNFNSTIGLQEVKTEGTEAALRGETDSQIFLDYRGVPVLSSYKPLDIPDMNWAIMSEIDEGEAFAPIGSLAKGILVLFLGLVVAIVVVVVLLSRSITRPIRQLTENAHELADGNLDVEIDTRGGDEIGDLARSFDTMRNSLKQSIEELQDVNQHLEERVAERTRDLDESERRSRSIVESAGEGIIVTNDRSEVILWNRAAELMFGYTADEMIDQNLDAIMPVAFREPHHQALEQANLSGRLRKPGKTHEMSGLHKDGREFPMELVASHWEVGNTKYYGGITRDITERKLMEAKLEEAFKTIKAQRDRMEIELNFAREIQLNMLPLIFPAFPTRSELSIYATLHSAREVGGDFYDFYFLDDDHLCFVIADVSGKGAPGALLMAVSKTLIKSRAADDHEPASILTHVNNELSRDNASSMFVTVFLGIVNVKTGEVEYTNAGHNPPYIKRFDGTVEKLDAFHGPVIGAMPGLTYKQDKASLNKGDIIVLYTDGVTEAMDESEQLYSDERFADLLQSDEMTSAEAAVEIAVTSVRQFQGEAEQADDITLLALEYKGSLEGTEENRLELVVKNRIEDLDTVEEKFQEFSERNGLPDTVRQKISIVVDEMLNNIVSYAYQDDADHDIEIDMELSGKRLVLTITDDGVPFNPFGLETPDISGSVAEREIGGLGIHLVRSVMDEYLYQRLINKNVVTLVKMIDE